MGSRIAPPPREIVDAIDQVVVLHDIGWDAFEALLAARGDAPVPRMTYLEGELELMNPSFDHERLKSWIGGLLETWAEVRDVDLSPYGSWTLRERPKERGVEPDECYIVGLDQTKARPDLAIEVIWTHTGLDKLDVYRKLGVGELWIWREHRIEVNVLDGETCRSAPRSELFPDLDLDELLSFLDAPSLTAAKRAYRAKLARGRP